MGPIKAVMRATITFKDTDGTKYTLKKGDQVKVAVIPKGSTYTDGKGMLGYQKDTKYIVLLDNTSVDVAWHEIKTID